MMAYKGSKTARDNFGKFIYQFQSETKTLIRKIERILNKLYGQKLSLLFNESCLNERLLPTPPYIYIYIYFILCMQGLLILTSNFDLLYNKDLYMYIAISKCVCMCKIMYLCICVCIWYIYTCFLLKSNNRSH